MLDVPAIFPVAIPDDDPIVATVVLLLDHVPPALLLTVVVSPAHTEAVPLMAAGIAFTVTVLVAKQPEINV
jgi:hypothetical protein